MSKKHNSNSKSFLLKAITFIVNLIAVLLLYLISMYGVKYFVGNSSWIPLIIALVVYVLIAGNIKKLVKWIVDKFDR